MTVQERHWKKLEISLVIESQICPSYGMDWWALAHRFLYTGKRTLQLLHIYLTERDFGGVMMLFTSLRQVFIQIFRRSRLNRTSYIVFMLYRVQKLAIAITLSIGAYIGMILLSRILRSKRMGTITKHAHKRKTDRAET